MEDTIMTMPAVALRGLTVLPAMMIHFDVSRKKSIEAIEKGMVSDQKVFLVTQRSPEVMDPDLEELFHMGTVAVIKQMVKMPGGVVRVMVEGVQTAELLYLDSTEPFLMAEIDTRIQAGEEFDYITREAMARVLREKLEEYGIENPKAGHEVIPNLMILRNLDELMLQTAIQIPWDYTVRQEYLEAACTGGRYEVLVHHLITEIEVSRVKREFQEKVKDAINKNQKDYILREQMRIIREELGEDSPGTEADQYREQLAQLKADKETKDKLTKEIERFQVMPSGSQEANVLRTYIETLLDLPWKKASRDNNDIRHAEEILNEDHYGLEKVKERVLEYLAVRTLTKKGNGPILCLVGPPGTGKTSVARSVARALNKKYVRISLGGIRDEAEIRGHRKTYVGAMPGRLVEGLRQAGVCNPLMLLDEIDKVSSDYKGDTSSALLEVLDGEQNVKFRDHYVEVPIDLSQVLFIATANTTQTIPRPLLDRMEIIEVNSYTENEKFHIGRDYLVGKQLERNGLTEDQLGDVMKESAQIAMTYVRSICPQYGVADDYFEKHNLHIHIPEGAVPKDGPSAGITMATAMVSAVTERPVDCKLAMTGEITLRGRVLPIGGLKEKILAAKMAHIRRVLVPDKNRPDIAELSREITRGLEIIYVKEMKEVLKEALR